MHREIAGQIEATRKIMNRLVADLEPIEHTIRILDPDPQLGRAKPAYSQDQAYRGEMRRHVLSALRTASKRLTSLDITMKVLAVRRLGETPANVTMIRKRVSAALWKMKSKGWLEEVPSTGD